MKQEHLEELFRASGAAGVPVREAPLAQILSDGRKKRRRRNGLTGAALTLVAVVAVAGVGGWSQRDRGTQPPFAAEPSRHASSPETGPTTPSPDWPGDGAEEMDRRSTEAYLEDTPGIPLALPQTLPAGYAWEGPGGSQADQSGDVVLRDSIFSLAGGRADASRVTVCLAEPDLLTCPQGDQRINRTLDGLQVVIAFSGPPAPTPEALEYWETVPLVTDLSVAWLE